MSRPEPKSSDPSHSEDDAPSVDGDDTVLIDYHGIIAQADGQQEVRHIRSPLQTFWPVAGTDRLRLQPGLNIDMTRDAFEVYSTKHPQTREMFESGEIKRLDRLPTNGGDISALVARTLSHEALNYIRDQVESGDVGRFTGAKADRRRASLIAEIDDRLAAANPVKIPITKWRAAKVQAKTESARLGMG